MINLPRFKNYKEFLLYYENSMNLLEEVKQEVEDVEEYIRGNDEFLVSIPEEYAEEKRALLDKGKITLFKYNDDLNDIKFGYVNYLLKELFHSSLHLLFAELVCDTIRMERIINEMFKSNELSDKVVDKINDQIFKAYKRKLSNKI